MIIRKNKLEIINHSRRLAGLAPRSRFFKLEILINKISNRVFGALAVLVTTFLLLLCLVMLLIPTRNSQAAFAMMGFYGYEGIRRIFKRWGLIEREES